MVAAFLGYKKASKLPGGGQYQPISEISNHLGAPIVVKAPGDEQQ